MGAERTLKGTDREHGEGRTQKFYCLLTSERMRLERTEDVVQITLAAVVPGLLAMMLFSYFLVPALVPLFLVLAVGAAALMVVPAMKLHRLHYQTWSMDSLPHKLVTSVIGMIYISVVSVFAISMLSVFEGFEPNNPTTFATVGGLLLALIGAMSYGTRTKERCLHNEKRFFPYPPEAVEERLALRLEREGHRHKRGKGPKGALFEMEATGMHVHVKRLNRSHSEVLVKNINDGNRHHLASLRACIEGA